MENRIRLDRLENDMITTNEKDILMKISNLHTVRNINDCSYLDKLQLTRISDDVKIDCDTKYYIWQDFLCFEWNAR